MEYKKTIILLMLVVFLLSIAGVSASEIDNTIASENANTIELSGDNDIIEDNLQTSEENEALASTDYDEAIAQTDTEVLGADSATYSDLAEEISHSGNITLTHKSYTYDEDAPAITISEANKVIDGNGAIIDMTGSTIRAFTVSASGVTIKNLTIKNANYNGNGGAIYFSSSGTVTNCNFTGNTANCGGAVFFNSNGNVTNCNFTNNTASGNGGAVFFNGNGEVTKCNFTNNQANAPESRGGAIHFEGSGTVRDCNFTDNGAFTGGAINGGKAYNCIFIRNIARQDGGAVYECDAYDCNFTDNHAKYGGAFYHNTAYGCNFINNTASEHGGAVFDGTVINCNFTNNTASRNGGAAYFNNGNVTNCNFTDNKATGDGGAILMGSGSVSHCNFTDNKAVDGVSYGGAILMSSGSVTHCNFTNNSAGYGGAVYFKRNGNVTNCNFTDNKATGDGGAILIVSGGVTNCNFTDNKAVGGASYGGAIFIDSGGVTNCNFTSNTARYGGAIGFNVKGTVTNCNFANNHANDGGAIFSQKYYTTADTCIFKENSGENVNTVIFPPTLNVDNFTTFYGSGEKLTFILTTNSSIPVYNGNISISVYYKNNDSWVGNYSCLSGDGWIVDLPVGSYYAVFNTEYAGFNAINGTINVIPNILYYANITSISTNNKTVNITAKSNIPQDIVEGKLLFILPNGDEINATYASNGIWWAVHTFDDCADYQINASYIGLSNVTVNNATISINKAKTQIAASPITTTYNVNKNLVITLKDDKGKALSGFKVTIDLNGVKTYTTDKNGQIKINVAKLVPKAYTAKITFNGNDDYVKSAKDVKVTVKKAKAKIKAKKKTYNAKKKIKKFTITLKDNKGKPIKKAKVTIKVIKIKKASKKKAKKAGKKNILTAKTNKKGKATFKINRKSKGKYQVIIKYKGNKYYNKATKKVKITIK